MPTVRGVGNTLLLTIRSGQPPAVQTGVTIVLPLLPLLEGGSPPPETVAVLATLGVAATVGSTVRVIGLGLVAPAAIGVLLVQISCVAVEVAQFQPVPVGGSTEWSGRSA